MKQKQSLLSKGIQGIAFASLLAFAQNASAASITVRVVDAESMQPVSGAAVCLGTKAAPQSYGAIRTDAEGEVIYPSSPRSNYVLSVAGDGAGDYAREHTPRGFDIIYYVKLNKSQTGSQCLAPVRLHSSEQGKHAIELTAVDVTSHSHGGGTVDVRTKVKGVEPTHIRVSTRRDFSDSRWMPYRQLTRHSVERVASRDLFVQVKRLVSRDDSNLEAISSTRVADLHWD